MKKIKTIITLVLLLTLVSPIVTSAEGKIYYTNLRGVELTETQYNNLKRVFDENTIATLDQKTIDYYKDEEKLSKSENEKYIKTEEYLDSTGKIIDTINTEVTKQEAELFVENQKNGVQPLSDSHQTNMKRINISIAATPSVKTITITNTWLSMPSVRSYDVIGFRNGTGNSIAINSVSAYQQADGQTVTYSMGGSNFKSTNQGCGISMNIVDSVSGSLSNSMSVTVINNSSIYTAYGTYQHAQSNVTLDQKKNYSINANGLGGVLDFASSVRGNYDGMQGVSQTARVGW